jgi:hypothetical protein
MMAEGLPGTATKLHNLCQQGQRWKIPAPGGIARTILNDGISERNQISR